MKADLKVYFLIFLLFTVNIKSLHSGIRFSGRSGSIDILTSGKLFLEETDSIKGWSRQSIVQAVGNDSPYDWDPSWTGETYVYRENAPEPLLPENQGDIILQTYYFELSKDLLLGPNRHLIIETSPLLNYTLIQGNGYTLNLAEGYQNLLQIESGHTVEIANAIIKNYDENSIYLPTGATLKFLNSTIEITDNRIFTKPLSLSGEVIINGYGYTVNLNPGSNITIDSGSMTINNLTLYGIQNENLKCVQSNSSLLLQNCNLFLTDDYKFRNGGLSTIDSIFSGFNIFSFESSLTFSISQTLILDTGVTFSYSPPTAKMDLLYMDSSSRLYMNGCTIKTTTTGLQLTNGTLIVDNQNQMFNDGATSISEAIYFGNGNIANDLTVEILPGAKLELMSGRIVYQNVNSYL